LDEVGHYSSAYDMAAIARKAMTYPILNRMAATRETTVYAGRAYPLTNSNSLLRMQDVVPGVDGFKTGYTGDAGQCPALAYRLSGSADQFASKALGPLSSVNFVACHDGFTLHDWAAYEQRHNEANGEDNRDGHGENFSRNWGHEGPTRDAGINQTRQCVARSVLATLAFSLGVPMIAAGDEMGRTQIGNNNAYCHDDALSWVNWELDKEQKGLLGFTRSVFGIRRAHRAFGRRRFWEGAVQCACGLKDATWLKADGTQVADGDWADGGRRTFSVCRNRYS